MRRSKTERRRQLLDEARSEESLTKKHIAALLGVCTRTVELWREAGQIPAPVVRGRTVRWNGPLFRQWMKREAAKAQAATT